MRYLVMCLIACTAPLWAVEEKVPLEVDMQSMSISSPLSTYEVSNIATWDYSKLSPVLEGFLEQLRGLTQHYPLQAGRDARKMEVIHKHLANAYSAIGKINCETFKTYVKDYVQDIQSFIDAACDLKHISYIELQDEVEEGYLISKQRNEILSEVINKTKGQLEIRSAIKLLEERKGDDASTNLLTDIPPRKEETSENPGTAISEIAAGLKEYLETSTKFNKSFIEFHYKLAHGKAYSKPFSNALHNRRWELSKYKDALAADLFNTPEAYTEARVMNWLRDWKKNACDPLIEEDKRPTIGYEFSNLYFPLRDSLIAFRCALKTLEKLKTA